MHNSFSQFPKENIPLIYNVSS